MVIPPIKTWRIAKCNAPWRQPDADTNAIEPQAKRAKKLKRSADYVKAEC